MLQLPPHDPKSILPGYVRTGEELVGNTIAEVPMLISPIFPKVGVVAISGSSDTGKSSLLRQLGMDIVSGKEKFLGFKIYPTHRSVIYVSTEDDESALSSLIKRQNVGNLLPHNFKSLRFIFETDEIYQKIVAELERRPADMVVIDAFADLYGGDLNRVNEVRKYLHSFVEVANKYKCLILFLHHTAKRTESAQPSKNNLIGSQGFEGKMRLVVELRKDFANPSSHIRHFCIVKGNYVPEEYKNRSYALIFSDNLTFEDTGIRVPFEQLAPTNGRQANLEARERARELHTEGLAITEIHRRMVEEGYTLARSTIGNYVKEE
jgi:hypothetical protein